MRSPILVGIVGYGYWGPNLARNFNSLESCRLGAICDQNLERLGSAKKLYPTVEIYTDFGQMLQDAELDAVIIATPLKTHFDLAKAAILARKHLLIEKPMAGTVAECLELIESAQQGGVSLMIGHTYIYSEPVRRITEFIRSGEIGDLRYINCQRLNLGIFKSDINVAWDLAPHDVSIILHVLGESPKTVNCQGNAHINPEVEDVTNLSLTFNGNRFATVQSSWLEPRKVRQMTFVGTRKMIIFDDLQPLEKIRIYDVRVEIPPHCDSFAEFQYSYHYGACYIPHLEQIEPLHKMCSHFLECVRNGNAPTSDGEQGLEIVRILEASADSLRANGAPVSLDYGNTLSSPVLVRPPESVSNRINLHDRTN